MLRCLASHLKTASLIIIEGDLDDINADNFIGVLKKKARPAEPIILDLSKTASFSPLVGKKLIALNTAFKEKHIDLIIRNVPEGLMPSLERLKGRGGICFEPPPKEIDISAARFIGRARGGDVYRLDKGTILKLYLSKHHYNDVASELRNAKAALMVGVPAARAADVVKVGRRFGITFKVSNARTFKEMILAHKENLENYGHKFARLIKQIHMIQGDPKVMKDLSLEQEKAFLRCEWMNGAERASMAHLISLLPKATTCITGAFRPGNIMATAGQLLFIDMAGFAIGHPYQDVAHVLLIMGPDGPEPYATNSTGLTSEERGRFLKGFLKTYFENLNKRLIDEQMKTVEMFLAIRSLLYIEEYPLNGEFHRERIRRIIKKY